LPMGVNFFLAGLVGLKYADTPLLVSLLF